jgi:hypothetical protein
VHVELHRELMAAAIGRDGDAQRALLAAAQSAKTRSGAFAADRPS